MVEAAVRVRPVATVPVITRSSTARRALPRVPIPVVVMLGLSGSCYAVSLSAVAAWQSTSDAAVGAARAPFASGVADLTQRNDRLAERLSSLGELDAQAAGAGGSVADEITVLERRLDQLSASVAAVDGAARGLPTRVALPPAVHAIRVGGGTAPAHAATGGSAVP